MSLKLLSFKKLFLVLALAELFSFAATANPGDTTWVTVYNLRKITQYGSYDTTAVFPTGKRYRKIRLHYILGRYACPAGTQYCGSWDYTTHLRARPAGMDSVEIARIITPYATDWLSLNKKHEYIVDVTDYAKDLEGTVAMRYGYEGYSWGFTVTLKLEFIEGVPPMDALSVKNIYDGYYTYGAAPTATNYIENYLVPKPLSYTAPVSKVFVKNTISGHGSDPAGCSEFCSRYYQLKLNNNLVEQRDIWRANCGINEVYPQTGTWVYDRGNWCPGAVVWPIYHNISNLTSPGNTFTVNVDMQPYTTGNPSGGYNFVSQMINYSAPNHTLDVSLEDVIAPTKDANYFRENPTCTNPTVKIKNTGTQTVTSVAFNYGLRGQTPLTYTWTTDSLKFLEEATVVLPNATAILSTTASTIFDVAITSVNGAADQVAINNTYTSQTTPVTVVPKDFIIKILTNNSTDGGTQANESTWTLYDDTGLPVYYRDGMSNATTYVDTIHLAPGCYMLSIDDSGCDGLSWWANTAGGTGSLRFYSMNGVNSFYTSPNDFGCNINKFFRVAYTDWVGISPNVLTGSSVDVFPNPATGTAYIKFDLAQGQNVSYKLTDITGKVISEKALSNVSLSVETVDISSLANGVYLVSIRLSDNSVITKKLVIQH